ncbi:MAG: GNAT family N-acetyltransferase [Clostridia bacterium]|nr:GNAT family N-acetyltransferase [Clostridia bacterium]
MKLIEPTMEYDRQIQAYRQEFLEYGGSMDGCGSLRRFDKTQDWLEQVQLFKRAETTPADFVPTTQYVYVRETDGKIMGVIQVRHRFNAFLERYGGHIGYSVCPSERRKGYATQMLRSVLPKCRELGIDQVLICCIQGNEGSRKVILNNGGRYESTVYEPERDRYLERYWIDLSDGARSVDPKPPSDGSF